MENISKEELISLFMMEREAWEFQEAKYVSEIDALKYELQTCKDQLSSILFQGNFQINEVYVSPSLGASASGEGDGDSGTNETCPICCYSHREADLRVLGCGHTIGLDCGKSFFVNRMSDLSLFPVGCPALIEGTNKPCQWKPSEGEVAEFLQDEPELLEKFSMMNATLLISREIFEQCPFCLEQMEVIRDHDHNNAEVECAFCHKMFCWKCHAAAHPEYECEEIKQLRKLESQIEGNFSEGNEEETEAGKANQLLKNQNKWQNCPNCGVMLEKVYGCNHVKCRCSQELCYLCGKPLTCKAKLEDPCLSNCQCQKCHYNDLHVLFNPRDLNLNEGD